MNAVTLTISDSPARLVAMTTHDRSLLVEAGAGSGKTAILAGRIALLLAAGVRPRAIAAVTFTELAASELLGRVRDFVDALLEGEVPRELDLALPAGLSPEQSVALAEAGAQIDEITCSTIHGFCQRLIKPYPVEANIDPGATLIDPAVAERLFNDILEGWLRDELDRSTQSLVAELVYRDPGQAVGLLRATAAKLRSARKLTAPATPALGDFSRSFVEASGRFMTFVMTASAHEVETLNEAEHFETMARALEALGDVGTDASLVTLLTMLPAKALLTASGEFGSYRKKGKWKTAAKLAGLPNAQGDLLDERASALREACCSAWTALRQAAAGHVIAGLLQAAHPIVDAFTQRKREIASLDFDDLIFAARALLRDHMSVREALAARYTHLLVDEFQDTDPLQAEIFWRLCGDAEPGADQEDWPAYRLRAGALFLVGDPKQAIYRFRGADVVAYLQAREAIRERSPDDVLSISTNFRSCTSILTYVNDRFSEPLSTARSQPGFTPLDAFHGDDEGALCVAALDVDCGGDGGTASSEVRRDCEADAVAELCARIIGSQAIIDRRGGSQRLCNAGDIALLAPSSTDLWRYEATLEARGIPVATQAGKGFYRRQEIQDLIALTRVLADGRDMLALCALLRGPLVGLTEEQLLDLTWAQPRKEGILERLPQLSVNVDTSVITNDVARAVLEQLQALRKRINGTTPHQLLGEAIDMIRVRPLVLARHGGQAERPLANVDLYLSLARPYGVRGLRAFADDMTGAWEDETRAAEARPDAQEDAVSLVTVHAAKGLEWPIVIPINMMTSIISRKDPIVERDTGRLYMSVFGAMPDGYDVVRKAEQDELERERVRLWYVAATRARELLVLPRPSLPPGTRTWSQLLDLDLANLPPIDVAHLPADIGARPDEPANEQTREIFRSEAVAIDEATSKLEWIVPSRSEAIDAGASKPAPLVLAAGDDELPAVVANVQGGRERGLILHKLLEECISGELIEEQAAIEARATGLIADLGLVAADDPTHGLAPFELAAAVVRTLALPEIAAVRLALVAELPVYAAMSDEAIEQATFGIVGIIGIEADRAVDALPDHVHVREAAFPSAGGDVLVY
ncbi:MAG: UvrD-helicase domain-containing protein [Sphingomonadaceae bacterium]|nr:UvrD-helicase domain-containing protein [Sphingomonadaceae bacterium]